MKNFFKPNIPKITFTVIVLLIVFGGQILYGRTAVISENGFEAASPLTNTINEIGNIIVYPVSLITSVVFPNLFLLSFVLFVLLLITEVYLIVCTANYIILAITRSVR